MTTRLSGLLAYPRLVWEYRHFWLALVRMDLRARYRRSVLGIGWSVAAPVGMTAVLCAVAHGIAQVDVGTYAPFVLSGLALWAFLSAAVLQGCICFQHNASYIRQEPAPVVIYPLRLVLTLGVQLLVTLAVALGFSWLTGPAGGPAAAAALVAALGLLFVLAWSLATLAAFAATYLPDAAPVLELGFQALFYLTPILYPPGLIRHAGLAAFNEYNPVAVFAELVRGPVLHGGVPDPALFGLAAGYTAAAAAAAVLTVAALRRGLIFRL